MRAISSRGDMATLSGGPTTLLGTSSSASTFGGLALRSMIDTVSGGGSFCTTTLPSTNFTLASLADTAICAAAPLLSANANANAVPSRFHIVTSPVRLQAETLALSAQANQAPLWQAAQGPMTARCVRAMSGCEARVELS